MKRTVVATILATVSAASYFPAEAATYLIRPDGTGDFANIQLAISDPGVVDGDIIELADGIFMGAGNRDIEFDGKAITVRSQSGNAKDCIIDCAAEPGRVEYRRGFYVRLGEGPGTRIEDLTIRNGTAGGDD